MKAGWITVPKNKLPLILMIIVIITGLVISILAFYFVSQQKKVREISLENDFKDRLMRIGADIETRTRSLIEEALQQASANLSRIDDPTVMLQGIKMTVLNHPIVQNLFIIRWDGKAHFLFPLSRRAASPLTRISDPAALHPQIRGNYLKGKDLEQKERKFSAAISCYLKALHQSSDIALHPYIYRAIAGAYFKMNRFPQALWYYKTILRRFPRLDKEAKDLYFLILRQAALAYKLSGQKEEALTYYLKLYETISAEKDTPDYRKFEFFQNEALDYLNRYARAGAPENKRFRQAAIVDRFKKPTEIDISLSWLYFDLEEDETNTSAGERGETSTLIRLRDLYAASDEKTQFYRDLQRAEWWIPGKLPTDNIVRLDTTLSTEPLVIGFKAIGPNTYLGFMPDLSFVKAQILPEIATGHTNDKALRIKIRERDRDPAVNDDPYSFKLLSSPLGELFPGGTLTLYANRPDLISHYVQREMWINYSLMAVLILTLIAGILLFYKYFSREAELVRLKSDFVDNVSHTLKTPLTRIGLLAENVQQGWVKNDNQKKEFFDTILSETGRLNDMIDNMLDFSRIEAGKKQYDLKEGSLQEIVLVAIRQYSAYIEKANFLLEVDMDDRLPPLRLDQRAVKLILVNLMHNALKYSHGEKYLGIKLSRRGRNAVLEIRDRGIGMSERDRLRVFEKFFRADDVRVRVSEGSGLGLFLVQHAVSAHGGKIEVVSRPDEGTTFIIYFPFIPENDRQDRQKRNGVNHGHPVDYRRR